MYLKLSCKITIGNYIMRGLHEVEVKRSVHLLIATCNIKLPLNAVMRNNATATMQRLKLADTLTEGSPITVELGYNGKLRTEFTGYVRRINYASPLELECEDELYLLRKLFFKKSFKNITAKALIQQVLDALKNEKKVAVKLYDKIPEVTIGNFYPNGNNGAWILEELRKFGITCYLTRINNELTLFAGLAYDLNKGRVFYKFNSNTLSPDDLKYNRAEDVKIKVELVNEKSDGTSTKYEFGEDGGDIKRVTMSNAAGKLEAKLRADAEINRWKVDGYKGAIETMLIPFAEPAMTADVVDPQFAERAGSYYISEVITSMGTGGARRKVTLEVKVK